MSRRVESNVITEKQTPRGQLRCQENWPSYQFRSSDMRSNFKFNISIFYMPLDLLGLEISDSREITQIITLHIRQ